MNNAARVLSGMRVTGRLHLGHYHGVLKNWLSLQNHYECFFFAADWHALTTHYDHPEIINTHLWEMFIDWLAAGINPGNANLFIQSQVPETAELHLLLSMITPTSWLERIPTYKDQQENIIDKDLDTYGFLGYPLLQSADILLYRASMVPVGEDQTPHIEFTREVARRFNHLYGQEPDFIEKAEQALTRVNKKTARLYRELRKSFQETGDQNALATAQALLENDGYLNYGDRERLLGYLNGNNKIILPEPQVLLTKTSKFPGLDGRKMSKSYHNIIGLREDPETAAQKIRTMPTDPARVRRHDPGTPEKCPVWGFHKEYSSDEVQAWVQTGCRTAGIGCLECKQPVIDSVKKELQQMRDNALPYVEDISLVKHIVAQGCEVARTAAIETLDEVKTVMGLSN